MIMFFMRAKERLQVLCRKIYIIIYIYIIMFLMREIQAKERLQVLFIYKDLYYNLSLYDNVLYEGNINFLLFFFSHIFLGKLVCEENIPCTNFVAIDNNFESTEGYLCVNVSTAYASNNHPKWCHHRF